ncbi:hypothetical protein AF72_03445 [Xylella taiwanensis]|uniref:Uncharacterized protein n=1 Tax=Xylella taiwanensis TaxID=1444770 RepID=Z9JLU3_9GAMM|nr:hypothetical protein AB672_09465 [Xylella taiwanensis]EWS78948.1 hypothetical protein AF72_03445 [Xylella taiwanensis]
MSNDRQLPLLLSGDVIDGPRRASMVRRADGIRFLAHRVQAFSQMTCNNVGPRFAFRMVGQREVQHMLIN